MARALRTITAEELIAALQDLPPDAIVAFSSNYGDHCRTRQIHSINGDLEELPMYESAYSDSGWAIRKEEYENEDDHKVFIIS